MLAISGKHIRAGTVILAAMLGVALVLGLSLSNIAWAQEPEADVSDPMQAAIEICFYSILGDYPHLSSSGNAVSAHGGWRIDSPATCPQLAPVTTELYAQNCVGIFCWWSWLSSQTRTVPSGGTSGKRATARHNCVSSATTRFQSVVDVDLPGIIETPVKKRTEAEVDCQPWWD